MATANSPRTFSPWRFRDLHQQKEHPVPRSGGGIIAVVLDRHIISQLVISQEIPVAVKDIAPGPRQHDGLFCFSHVVFLVFLALDDLEPEDLDGQIPNRNTKNTSG